MKSWFSSKTIWVNAAVMLLTQLPDLAMGWNLQHDTKVIIGALAKL